MPNQNPFTPIINDHPLFNLKDYETLLEKINSKELNNYSKNNDYFKLLLNIITSNSLVNNEEYLSRLGFELEGLVKTNPGFENTLLIYDEIARFQNENNIFWNMGRGSAGNSLILYFLNITKIDPIYWNLPFERFVMDIDVDVPNRKDLITYFKNRYPGKVSYKATESFYSIKGAFKKVMSNILNTKELYEYTKVIDQALSSSSLNSLMEGLENLLNLKEFKNYDEKNNFVINQLMDKINAFQIELEDESEVRQIRNPKIFDLITVFNPILKNLFLHYDNEKKEIRSLINTLANYGVHAGGLIFSDQLDRFKDIRGDEKYLETNLDMPVSIVPDIQESVSYLKIDILNLTPLAEINQTDIPVNAMPYKEAENSLIWNDLFKDMEEFDGKVFQIKKWIRNAIENFNIKIPKGVLDFAIISSLCRPGPMKANYYGTVNNDVPDSFKNIVGYTRGHIVFQEDIIEMAKLKGIVDSKDFLKNISRDIILDEYYKKFTKAELRYIQNYSKYTFNKAHALAYAYNTFFHFKYCFKNGAQ